MAQIISDAWMRIVDELIGHSPQTISELLSKVNVTRTAITEQLDELAELGLVVRELERLSSRGRPRYRYSLTLDAIPRIYPGIQRLAISTLWNAIKKLGGEELLMQIITQACEILSDHFGSKMTGITSEERFLEIMKMTAPENDMTKWQINPDGSIDVWRRVCIIEGINSAECRFCGHHKALLESIVGEKLELRKNRYEGAAYCVYRLTPKKQEDAEDSEGEVPKDFPLLV